MSLMISLSLQSQMKESMIARFVLTVMNLGDVASKPKSVALTIGQAFLASCMR
jgi:hypothetical protein